MTVAFIQRERAVAVNFGELIHKIKRWTDFLGHSVDRHNWSAGETCA